MSEYVEILQRPRRNRKSPAIRRLVQETQLLVMDMVAMFLVDGVGQKQPVESMPGVFRLSLDLLIEQAQQAFDLGINAIALFPAIEESKKSRKSWGELSCGRAFAKIRNGVKNKYLSFV